MSRAEAYRCERQGHEWVTVHESSVFTGAVFAWQYVRWCQWCGSLESHFPGQADGTHTLKMYPRGLRDRRT